MKAEAAIGEADDRFVPVNMAPVWVMPAVMAFTFLADGVLALVCFISSFILRTGDPILSPAAWAWSEAFTPYAGVMLFAIIARLVMLLYERVYRFAGAFSYVQEAIKVFRAVLIGSLLISAWAFLFRGGLAFREFSYSRGVFFIDFALSLVLFTVFHLSLRFLQTQVRRRGINLIPTLIVGTNYEAAQTALELAKRQYLGYRVIGIVEGRDTVNPGKVLDLENGRQLSILGTFSELAALIKRYRIQEVIIADDSVESESLFEAMMQVGRKHRVEFRFTPKISNFLPQKTSVEQVGLLPMVRLFREPLSDVERFFKRLSDLVIVSAAGFVTAPIWLVISILIKIDSPGPIFFKQERVGMDGRLFLCYKFRTMQTGSDEDLHREMYRKNIGGLADANAGDHTSPVYGKVKDDPRVTRVGRWLRRTSLDELPQILNVFRGEMSIVGPRPPIPYEVESYDIWHRKRLDVRPGMTGLWQVSGRNRMTFEEMVKLDLYYIENWSLLLDLKIILLTLPAVLSGDGAR
ncbi:MAG: sugar transferase [Pyrinomonadaceae bacterium]